MLNQFRKLNALRLFRNNEPQRTQRKKSWNGFKVLFCVSLMLCLWLSQIPFTTYEVMIGEMVQAQTSDADQLVNKGVKSYSSGDFRGAIEQWQKALNLYQQSNHVTNQTIVKENLARAYQQVGEGTAALKYWMEVVADYRGVGDEKQLGRSLTELAQIYNSLGQPRQAIQILCGGSNCSQGSALQIAQTQKDELGEVAALGSLGEAYRLLGDYEQAIKYLRNAEKDFPIYYNFAIQNSLGNVYMSRGQLWHTRFQLAQERSLPKAPQFQEKAQDNYQQAANYFQSSLTAAKKQNDVSAQMRSLLNLIQLHYRSQAFKLTSQTTLQADIQQALSVFNQLPNSAQKVYTAIDLATLSQDNLSSAITQCPRQYQLPNNQVINLLNQAIDISKNLSNSRSQSYAFGVLGHFWECQKDYDLASKYTQQALWASDQNLNAKDSLYLWEWQAGRIFKVQKQDKKALAAYQRAFNTLEEIRSDIITATRDLQLDFRDVIQPLYRDLAESRLELATNIPATEIKIRQQELNFAQETIDSLKLAELQNYFGNDCILTAINDTKVEELLGENTAVFNSIIFHNRVAILLSLPNKEKRFKWIQQQDNFINFHDLKQEISNFDMGLREAAETFDYNTTQAAKLYDWMIRPFTDDLNSQKITTLVFIQDGFLRNIPMAALYDQQEQKYLIEKFALATTPSLRLTAPKIQNRQISRALILGLTKEVTVDEQKFAALDNILTEIQGVEKGFPASKILIDDNFQSSNLAAELDKNAYPVIHIASHAQFGTIPEDTYIVTGGEQNKLTIEELEKTLRAKYGAVNAVELLTLTACQTAVGDERATLGLAGVALQVGVRSAIASLWTVQDESTSLLIREFYHNLQQAKMSKAEALRQAQIKLIHASKIPEINDQYDNPNHWASFILIGNWL